LLRLFPPRSNSSVNCSVFTFFSLLFLLHFPVQSLAQNSSEEDGAPELISIFPTGGERGTTVLAEIRGTWLDGAYAVWLDTNGLKARLLKVEEMKDDPKPKMDGQGDQKKSKAIYKATVEIQIERTTHHGVYLVRLISDHGISNPVDFPVIDGPVVVESSGSHQTVELAQKVTLPAVINGKLGETGQQDYYSFYARRGEELQFEAVRGQKPTEAMAASEFAQFTPQVALCRTGGDWFDLNRPTRLLFAEERSSDLIRQQSGGSYRFNEDGQYLFQVSGVFGQGCPDCTYQVRVISGQGMPQLNAQFAEVKNEWSERSLSRELPNDWMTMLEARAVQGTGSKAQAEQSPSAQEGNLAVVVESQPKSPADIPSHPSSFVEIEPNDDAAHAQLISIPAVLEGAIQHPGDMDSFRFKVESGQMLAFEVETPALKPPYFHPRLGIVDSQNKELFSNVERRLSMFNNNADPQVYLKDIQPKVIYTFTRAGEYILQVRDITSRYGGSDFRYKIFVRPEIPHLGQVTITEGQTTDETRAININRINLTPGVPKQLTLIASYEEGFTGNLSFTITGLPEGVQVTPSVQFHQNRAPLEITQNSEIVAPKKEQTTIVLLADHDAKLTSEPKMIQLHCQLIADGKLGPNLLVQELPLMVVEGRMKEGQKPGQGK
jgi:hypothetical protein